MGTREGDGQADGVMDQELSADREYHHAPGGRTVKRMQTQK